MAAPVWFDPKVYFKPAGVDFSKKVDRFSLTD